MADLFENIGSTLDEMLENGSQKFDELVDQTADRIDEFVNKVDTTSQQFSDVLEGFGGIPVRNMTCITMHCGSKIAACGMDEICRQNMQCAGGCAEGNTTCTFYCSESYQTPTVDAMMRCMFVDHQCLSLPPPDPINNATCREPTSAVVPAIDQALLDGEWYVIGGFNPLYDCFDCQELFFNWAVDENGQWNYRAHYDLIAVNNTLIWNDATMVGHENTPGIISMFGSSGGLDNNQDWYFLYQDETSVLAYYCGNTLSWKFEGVMMMSKTREMNPASKAGL